MPMVDPNNLKNFAQFAQFAESKQQDCLSMRVRVRLELVKAMLESKCVGSIGSGDFQRQLDQLTAMVMGETPVPSVDETIQKALTDMREQGWAVLPKDVQLELKDGKLIGTLGPETPQPGIDPASVTLASTRFQVGDHVCLKDGSGCVMKVKSFGWVHTVCEWDGRVMIAGILGGISHFEKTFMTDSLKLAGRVASGQTPPLPNCPECSGTGKRASAFLGVQEDCPTCGGKGKKT